eukprot:Cvel_30247.t2-p1 / transcript=Cvel_30247.t2 / gene=Cvel_30247 / organism=Chromera_velia_CCMP2878 / gene_product=hypothetical protein / transcript_product=hypothetical protein / location=Cvel_scaffold4288:6071-6366(+) / protein_length=98 / sequence_SO=supercontig / SO=protein_coding / is_pseudo=false
MQLELDSSLLSDLLSDGVLLREKASGALMFPLPLMREFALFLSQSEEEADRDLASLLNSVCSLASLSDSRQAKAGGEEEQGQQQQEQRDEGVRKERRT